MAIKPGHRKGHQALEQNQCDSHDPVQPVGSIAGCFQAGIIRLYNLRANAVLGEHPDQFIGGHGNGRNPELHRIQKAGQYNGGEQARHPCHHFRNANPADITRKAVIETGFQRHAVGTCLRITCTWMFSGPGSRYSPNR